MSKIKKAAAAGLVACVLLSLISFGGKCADIRQKVVRIHVLANSDSREDQQLKLRVRDAVLEAADGLTEGCADREEALVVLAEHCPELTRAAEACLEAEQSDYPVQVSLKRLYFTTREYEKGTLPAGMYDAVQVEIGEAAGQNWWCVIFPSICLPASGADWDTVLTPEETEIVENAPRYRIGFKTVEWWEGLCAWFRDRF